MENILPILKKQLEIYPKSAPQDILKALFQAVFGCEHFVTDEQKARERLQEELRKSIPCNVGCLTEDFGEYSRIHLSKLDHDGISADTLLSLFIISAKAKPKNEKYQSLVEELPLLCRNGELPFSEREMKTLIEEQKALGYPPLHHSEIFRESYNPSYRIIRSEYADLFPLFQQIEKTMTKKEHTLIAIDGCCTGGKSTLARLLHKIYGADIIHMDDYFLTPEMKTEERLSQAGGNVDYERFLKEVLSPLSKGQSYISRPYRCHGGYYEAATEKIPSRLTVVEGSYSLHKALYPHYDLKIFLELDSHLQQLRVKSRNPEMFCKFIEEWIPLENTYFEKTNIKSRCDIHIKTNEKIRYEVIKNEKK
ncbi:MAG: hypothetical protein E7387_07920 [Ruminococcaceae bacterium]|nr:hypothetical protein [Oscillospiraceae bacterium]